MAAMPQAQTNGFTRSPLRPARQGTAMTVNVLSREARLAGVRNRAQLCAKYLHTQQRQQGTVSGPATPCLCYMLAAVAHCQRRGRKAAAVGLCRGW